MSDFLPSAAEDQDPEGRRARRAAWLVDLRGWLFLGMGLAGILTVALIVTADESYAGIDGMRAVRAILPGPAAVDPAAAPPALPLVGGLATAIHDLAPFFFGAGPSSSAIDGRPAASPQPATPASAAPTGSPGSVAQPPTSATPPAAPTVPPSPPAPTTAPAPSVAPVTHEPPQTLAVSTDRGATAIVSLADLVPGDSIVRTIAVQNRGTLAFRYTVSASHTAATPLWSDATAGLQLTVAASGGGVLYAGPVSALGRLAGPTTLAPATSETLTYTFAFPAGAANTFQGLVQDLTLVFDAVEFP